MSQFTDYNTKSQHYDGGRVAVGADIMAGLMVVHLQKDLKNISILDAGCGTGNYTEAILQLGARDISMMDASTGMLNKAQEKIERANLLDRVRLCQAFLPEIPFERNIFDVVMINQVLHHLQKNPDGVHFPEIARVIQEAKRVLKSSGLLFITTSTPEQLYALWYTNINKDAQHRYLLKHPTVDQFKKMLQETGFKTVSVVSILGCDYMPNYDNLLSPLDKVARSSDSFWACASEHEVQEICLAVKEMNDKGTLQNFFREHDHQHKYGSFVIIVAKKDENNMYED